MDSKTVLVVTAKGTSEIKNQTSLLFGDVKRALTLVDGKSSVAEVSKRAAPSLHAALDGLLQELVDGGFIVDKAKIKTGSAAPVVMSKIAVPVKKPGNDGEELDFTSFSAPAPAADDAAKVKAQQEAPARAAAEAARLKAEQEAVAAKAKLAAQAQAKQAVEAARIKGEQEAAAAWAQLEGTRIKAEQEAQARAAAEAKAKQEAEAARIKAQQDAEAARIKAEVELRVRLEQEAETARRKTEEEAARVRAEAARIKAEEDAARARAEAEAARAEAERVRVELEAARIKAEQEAAAALARARQEAEAARLKAAEEAARAQAEAEAEAKAQAMREAELIRRKAEEDAAQARAEAAALRLKMEQEAAAAQARAEAARVQAEQEIASASVAAAAEKARLIAAKAEASGSKARTDSFTTRTMIATVLFFDVVGYTKESVSKQIELKGQFNKLVSEFISDIEGNQRIILDTGDGAALGFLQHPEHAIEVALKFRDAVTANKHQDFPELKVRMGIHLGPVNVLKDMNGQLNMVGDGINDAQRIMSFAMADQIFISRAYFDVASRLSNDYAKLFQYHGMESDKHGRQHQVYVVMGSQIEEQEQPQQDELPYTIELDSFDLAAPTSEAAVKVEQAATAREPEHSMPVLTPPEATPKKSAVEEEQILAAQAGQTRAAEAARLVEEKRQAAETTQQKAEQDAADLKEAETARKMADEQSRVWVDAEQRAKVQATMQSAAQAAPAVAAPRSKPPKVRGKPFPLGKIAAGIGVLVVLMAAVLPMFWPMQQYVAQVEQQLSTQLQQPVHIGSMKAVLLPLPKLELQEVSIGLQNIKAGSVVLNFGVSALFSNTRPIRQLELNDLTLKAETFDVALSALRAVGSDARYPVAHLALQRGQVSGEGWALPALSGTLDWEAGLLSKASLHSEDNKLSVELLVQQAAWQFDVRIKDSALPLFPGVKFNELNTKGVADTNGARFNEVDGSVYGGLLNGKANLNWQRGWQLQGHMGVKLLELEQAYPNYGISGELESDINFVFAAEKLGQIGAAPHVESNFVARKGVINKIDFVETATSSGHRGSAGGRTHFEELSGSVQVEGENRHFRQLKLVAGVVNATGTLDVAPGGELAGRLALDLRMRASQGSVPMQLGGTLSQPVLRLGR